MSRSARALVKAQRDVRVAIVIARDALSALELFCQAYREGTPISPNDISTALSLVPVARERLLHAERMTETP